MATSDHRPLRARRSRAGALLLGLALLAGALSLAAPAAEGDTPVAFDVPAGPMERALNRLATQAGITLSFQPAAVAGRRSAGLSGEYTVERALEELLGVVSVDDVLDVVFREFCIGK